MRFSALHDVPRCRSSNNSCVSSASNPAASLDHPFGAASSGDPQPGLHDGDGPACGQHEDPCALHRGLRERVAVRGASLPSPAPRYESPEGRKRTRGSNQECQLSPFILPSAPAPPQLPPVAFPSTNSPRSPLLGLHTVRYSGFVCSQFHSSSHGERRSLGTHAPGARLDIGSSRSWEGLMPSSQRRALWGNAEMHCPLRQLRGGPPHPLAL